jgi:hypothetical protein
MRQQLRGRPRSCATTAHGCRSPLLSGARSQFRQSKAGSGRLLMRSPPASAWSPGVQGEHLLYYSGNLALTACIRRDPVQLVDQGRRVIVVRVAPPSDAAFAQSLEEAAKLCADSAHLVPPDPEGIRGDVRGFSWGFSHGNGRTVSLPGFAFDSADSKHPGARQLRHKGALTPGPQQDTRHKRVSTHGGFPIQGVKFLFCQRLC